MVRPVVWIVGTGGTIASKYDARLGGHTAAATAEELVATVPGLHEIDRFADRRPEWYGRIVEK